MPFPDLASAGKARLNDSHSDSETVVESTWLPLSHTTHHLHRLKMCVVLCFIWRWSSIYQVESQHPPPVSVVLYKYCVTCSTVVSPTRRSSGFRVRTQSLQWGSSCPWVVSTFFALMKRLLHRKCILLLVLLREKGFKSLFPKTRKQSFSSSETKTPILPNSFEGESLFATSHHHDDSLDTRTEKPRTLFCCWKVTRTSLSLSVSEQLVYESTNFLVFHASSCTLQWHDMLIVIELNDLQLLWYMSQVVQLVSFENLVRVTAAMGCLIRISPSSITSVVRLLQWLLKLLRKLLKWLQLRTPTYLGH